MRGHYGLKVQMTKDNRKDATNDAIDPQSTPQHHHRQQQQQQNSRDDDATRRTPHTSATNRKRTPRPVVPVYVACDALRECVGYRSIHKVTRMLQHSIHKCPVQSYNPTDVFHTIRRTTLRLYPTLSMNAIKAVGDVRPRGESGRTLPRTGDVDGIGSGTSGIGVGNARQKHSRQQQQQQQQQQPPVAAAAATESIHSNSHHPVIANVMSPAHHTSNLTDILWVCAALVCKSIGPSWRYKTHHHRDTAHHSTPHQEHQQHQQRHQHHGRSSHDIPHSIVLNLSKTARGGSHSNTTRTAFPPASTSGVIDPANAAAAAAADLEHPYVSEMLPSDVLSFTVAVIELFEQYTHPTYGQQTQTTASVAVTDNMDRTRIIQDETEEVHKSFMLAQTYILQGLFCDSSSTPQRAPMGSGPFDGHGQARISNTGEGTGKAKGKARQVAQPTCPPRQTWKRNRGLGIVAVDESVDRILERWLGFIATSWHDSDQVDWRFCLDICRVVADMVSIGWYPTDTLIDQTLQALFVVAENGITVLRSANHHPATGMHQDTVCHDILAASSASAETISTLLVLCDRALIPTRWRDKMVRQTFHLHVATGVVKKAFQDDDIADLASTRLSVAHHEELEATEIQIESCFTDSFDCLLTMLNNAEFTFVAWHTLESKVMSLLSTGSSTQTDQHTVEEAASIEANAALHIMMTALWGHHSETDGSSALQMLWGRYFNLVHDVSKAIHSLAEDLLQHEYDVPTKPSSQLTMSASPATTPKLLATKSSANQEAESPSSTVAQLFTLLPLAISTVTSLGYFIDHRLKQDPQDPHNLMTAADGHSFVNAFLEAVGPWLAYNNMHGMSIDDKHNRQVNPLISQGVLEVESVIIRLCSLLDQQFNSGAPAVFFIQHFNDQVRLYNFLLQPEVFAVGTLNNVNRHVLSSSWIQNGLLPYRPSEITQTVRVILGHAFAVTDDNCFVHSARARLDALRMLTLEDQDAAHVPTHTKMPHASHSERSQPSSALSPLSITRHLASTRKTLLDEVLMPLLSWLAQANHKRPKYVIVRTVNEMDPTSSNSSAVGSDKMKPKRDAVGDGDGHRGSGELGSKNNTNDISSAEEGLRNGYRLQRYSVRIVGKILRDPSSSKKTRKKCLQLLKSIALDAHGKIARPVHDSPDDMIDDLSTWGSVRLVATREIASSICTAFIDAPNMQSNLQNLISALCEIIASSSIPKDRFIECETRFYEPALLCLSAIIPLSRLRLSDGGHLGFLSQRDAVCPIPRNLLIFLSRSTDHPSDQRPITIIASSVMAHAPGRGKVTTTTTRPRHHSGRMAPSTIISFENMIGTLCQSLDYCCNRIGACQHEQTHMFLSTIIDFTSKTISSIMMSGAPVDLLDAVRVDNLVNVLRSESSRCDCRASVLRLAVQVLNAALINQGRGTSANRADTIVGELSKNPSTRTTWSCVGHRFLASIVNFSSANDKHLICVAEFIRSSLSRVVRSPREHHDGCLANESSGATKRPSGTADKENPAETASGLASSLSTLCEILQSRPAVLQQHGGALAVDFVQMIRGIIATRLEEPNYILYLSIRCMGLLISLLNQDSLDDLIEAGIDFHKTSAGTSADDHTQPSIPSVPDLYVPHVDFLNKYAQVLLQNRSQVLHRVDRIRNSAAASRSYSYHRDLASEIVAIEEFQTSAGINPTTTTTATNNDNNYNYNNRKSAKDNAKGNDSKAAEASWLCGDSTLLTFRRGSPTSRYRGWIEIIVRCPTSRRRALVRMNSQVSLANPSPARATLRSSRLSNMKVQEGDVSFPKISPLPTKLRHQENDIINEAQSLMQTMDELFTNDNRRGILGKGIGSRRNNSNDTLDSLARWSNHSIQSLADAMVGTTTDDGGPDKADEVNEVSIRQWIRDFLCSDRANNEDFALIVEHLRQLGFDEEVLKSWTLAPTSADSSDGTAPSSGANASADSNANASRLIPSYLPVKRMRPGHKLNQAISIVDRRLPCLAHKVALLYAGPHGNDADDQDPETIILGSKASAPAFHRFASGLGGLVPTNELRYYSGGLDVTEYESDGALARAWISDDSDPNILDAARSVIVFHDVTWMPDEINTRKRHVGNDAVAIVFVDKDSPVAADIDLEPAEMRQNLISGHFGFVTIFVSPFAQNDDFVRVCVRIRKHLPSALRRELMYFVENEIVPTVDAANVVRGIAIRADLACRSVLDTLPPPFPCLERYRILYQLKRLAVGKGGRAVTHNSYNSTK